jgi:ABC-type siderophore export system fused ATPase/permease subunit
VSEREREKLYKYVLVMTQFEWEVLSQSETIWEGTKIMTLKKKKKKKTLSSSLPILTKSKEMHIKSMEKKFENLKIIIIKLLFPNCYLKIVHR